MPSDGKSSATTPSVRSEREETSGNKSKTDDEGWTPSFTIQKGAYTLRDLDPRSEGALEFRVPPPRSSTPGRLVQPGSREETSTSRTRSAPLLIFVLALSLVTVAIAPLTVAALFKGRTVAEAIDAVVAPHPLLFFLGVTVLLGPILVPLFGRRRRSSPSADAPQEQEQEQEQAATLLIEDVESGEKASLALNFNCSHSCNYGRAPPERTHRTWRFSLREAHPLLSDKVYVIHSSNAASTRDRLAGLSSPTSSASPPAPPAPSSSTSKSS